MSTTMDEDDWAHTLAVFRACLPRRGRRILEALHFFTVENIRWRALPERFGHWNSVWKRFDPLSKASVFEAFFDTLASSVLRRISFRCSTRPSCALMCRRPEQGGQEEQALGRSRGGFTTKIHAKSDASGDISAFDLTGGEAFDGRHSKLCSTSGPTFSPRRHLRQRLRQQGQPGRSEEASHRSRHFPQSQRKRQADFLRPHPLQARVRIEHVVGRLKRFKRVALRCEKTARNFRSGTANPPTSL